MQAVLTSREWAFVSWAAITLTFIVLRSDLRGSFSQVLRSLTNKLILMSLGASALYISACVLLLKNYSFWTAGNLKTTLIWGVTFTFSTMFQLQKLNDAPFYKEVLRNAFNLTVAVTFVTEFYTFSFIVEFVILPILVMLTLLWEMSKRNPQHKSVEYLTGCILSLITATYVLYSAYRTFANPASLFTASNGRDLAVPALLTALYLPFAYGFGIIGRYSEVFAALNIWLPDNRLRQYAKRQAIIRFRSDVKTLDRWRHLLMVSRPRTRDELLQTVANAWAMKSRDLHPVDVAPEDGWEPVRASQILAQFHLGAADYKQVCGDEWSASAPYLNLDSETEAAILQNNIAYYVAGSQFAATELTVILNVNAPENELMAHARFIEIGMALIRTALGEKTLKIVRGDLTALRPFNRHLDGASISLDREEWHGGTVKGGYEWALVLTRGKSDDTHKIDT